MVNNLEGKKSVCNKIENLKHTINNNEFSKNSKEFYKSHNSLMVELAEENIVTITDLYNYVDWIKDDK